MVNYELLQCTYSATCKVEPIPVKKRSCTVNDSTVLVPNALILEEKVEKMNKLIFGETDLGINWQIFRTSLEISRRLGVWEVIFRNSGIFRQMSLA